MAPVPQILSFLTVFVVLAGESRQESMGEGSIVHMKALLIFLNLGQVSPPFYPILAPGFPKGLATLLQRFMAVVRDNRPTSYFLCRGDSQ